MIKRDYYLEKIKDKMWNGAVKIITGIRRCGKSYILNEIFKGYLLESGVAPNHIISVALDLEEFELLQNPRELSRYVREHILDDGRHYVFIDEIQMSHKILKEGIDPARIAKEDEPGMWFTFYDVLNSLNAKPNLDIYVTGSNSKMLSKDVASNFRGRKTEIQMHPLSFSEFHDWKGGDLLRDWDEYKTFGGMPQAVLESDERAKVEVLNELFANVYIKDVVERNNIADPSLLESIVDVVSSSIGSLTNPKRLSDTIASREGGGPSAPTVRKYLAFMKDAYIFREAKRYDVRGKKYLDYPMKYYAEDVGLRNARLGFREQEETHLMENVIYNELVRCGYQVDVGVVDVWGEENGKNIVRHHEIDFVVNTGFEKVYIQSAFSVSDPEYKAREVLPLNKSGDNFRKIVVTSGASRLWTDDDGISYVGILTLLLNPTIVIHI